jgi:hypothetical protein
MDKAIAVFDQLNYPMKPEAKGRCYYLKSLALLQLGKKAEAEAARKVALHYDREVIDRVKIKVVDDGTPK